MVITKETLKIWLNCQCSIGCSLQFDHKFRILTHPYFVIRMIARVIKVKNSCGQYGSTAPFIWALLDTMVKAKFTHQDWKGDLSGNLFGIRLAPDKLFQEFLDRLVKTAYRIFRDPQAQVPFVTQLSYENANTAHCGHPAIQSKARLIWIYVSLCRNWTLIHLGSSYGCCLRGDYSTSNAFTEPRL